MLVLPELDREIELQEFPSEESFSSSLFQDIAGDCWLRRGAGGGGKVDMDSSFCTAAQ